MIAAMRLIDTNYDNNEASTNMSAGIIKTTLIINEKSVDKKSLNFFNSKYI